LHRTAYSLLGGRLAVRTIERTTGRSRYLGLAVVCLGIFVMVIDNTVLNIALPALSRDLGASNSQLQWIVDAYTLVYAGTMLTAGSLGDRFGRARSLWWGSAGFGIASAVAAFAPTSATLIASRAAMGVCAAFVTPASLSIVTNLFTDPVERGRGIAVWAAVASTGAAAGPVLGGSLLQHFWWGSVFLVNIPVVIVILVCVPLFVPESKNVNVQPLDPLGAVLSTAALMSLVWATIDAPERGWTSPTILAVYAVSVALGAAFIRWEMTCQHPMLDLAFFRARAFSVATAANSFSILAGIGMMYMQSLMLQGVFGYSPLGAGLRLAPFAVINAIVGIASHRIVARHGLFRVMVGGLAVQTVMAAVLTTYNRGSGYLSLFVMMMIFSAAQALVFAPAVASAMSAVARDRATVASAANNTMRQTFVAFAVAIMGSVLASGYRSRLSSETVRARFDQTTLDEASKSLGHALKVGERLAPAQRDGLVDTARDAFMHGMRLATLVAVASCGVALIGTWLWLPRDESGLTTEQTTAMPAPRPLP
jgi:EmrB/QacA subfamily drug resistance transporter